MTSRSHYIPVLTAVLLALLTAACGNQTVPPKSPAPASSAPARAAKLAVMNGAPHPDFVSVWAAADGGIFQKNGLDLDLMVGTSGGATTTALVAGDVQLVNAGGTEVVGAIAAGNALVVVGVLGPVYDLLLEVKPSIKQASDLKGKVLGIPTAGGAYDAATRVALKQLGLDAKDVSITPLGSLSAATAAIINGTVDGGVLGVSDTIPAEANGLRPLLNLAGGKLPAAFGAVYLQRAYADANRGTVQRYVDSLVEGMARVKRDKPFALSLYKKYLKIDDERVLNLTYDFYSKDVYPSLPFPTAEQFMDSKDLLSQQNRKVQSVDLPKIVDQSFVKDAADRGLGRD